MEEFVLDDFSSSEGWRAFASGEAELHVSAENGALRLDFDFHEGGGFVVARKVFPRLMPADYAFAFRVWGRSPRNKLEFKLVDPSGKNVWRWQEEDFDFREMPHELHLHGSGIDFAWGPAGGGRILKLGAIEFVISAGPGGKGTIWIDRFRFQDRTLRRKPRITTSSSASGCNPDALLSPRPEAGWRSVNEDKQPWVCIDFQEPHEYGGLIADWLPRPARRAFTVQASDDGVQWRDLHVARDARGARTFIHLPLTRSRFLRLVFEIPCPGVKRLSVQSFAFSRTLIETFHAIAAASTRGFYPRYLCREQSYWTCAGSPDGITCALINEEGMIEPDKGTFSLEPFLRRNGDLITWADVRRSVSMEKDGLPIPSAHWSVDGLKLQTTAFATGSGTKSVLFVRYRVRNSAEEACRVKLFVAARPFQVNPPWQEWNQLGGVSKISTLAWKQGALWVNGDKAIIPLEKPSSVGMAAFEQGSVIEHLAAGTMPDQTEVSDEFGFASAAMGFTLNLAPDSHRDVFVAVPFGKKHSARQVEQVSRLSGPAQFSEAVRVLKGRLNAVSFHIPEGLSRDAAETFKTAAGQILINRDGPALQPGPRRYTRSWIRDGVIMGAALLRAGEAVALPEFIRWYAPFQRPSGFVPCCVDRNGPDWLVEHDSHGQLIFGVRECFRFSGDLSFLKEMWPHVRKAARFIERLRAHRMTVEYHHPEKRDCYGLLPESASHEGYLAHPVHSYWDDFWALRGLLDASAIADRLGKKKDAEEFEDNARALRESLRASIRIVIAEKHLNYIPGSVEWADFDPTATSNAISLLQAVGDLPSEQLDAMFDLFIRDFRRKHNGEMEWNNYTAYEIRIVGALVRLGKRAEAIELLERFLDDRRPLDWNQWPEISWRDPRSPGHLGDVPHTWIASEYMLAFASLFAWERESDDALVLAAGLPANWLGKKGISVKGLRTWYGPLDLTLKPGAELVAEIGGTLDLPRGGLVIRPPCPGPIRSVTINGKPAETFRADEVIVREFPARVVFSFHSSP